MPEPEVPNHSPAVSPDPPVVEQASASIPTSQPNAPAAPELSAVLVFPENLISSIDMSRTARELAALDESLYQANVREPGQSVKLARSSRILEDLAAANNISLLDTEQRGELLATMKGLIASAPRIHISFAVEPSAKFSQRMVIWLRQNIHPRLLLEIGLQPTLAVGCVVRTNNKVFDMSLRHRFKEQRHLLREKIGDLPPEQQVAPEVAAP